MGPTRGAPFARRCDKAFAAGLLAVALCATLGASASLAEASAPTPPSAASSLDRAFPARSPHISARAKHDPGYPITWRYVVRFYPLWFTTGIQAELTSTNLLSGPDTMSPAWAVVVGPNDDTIYATSLVDLSEEPQVLTIPPTTATYSLLTGNAFGTIFETEIPLGTPGAYGLVPPGWRGALPTGVKKVPVPYEYSRWIIRADKYSSNVDMIAEAEQFRASLHLASLSDYRDDPSSGATHIFPVEFYSARVKTLADQEIAVAPTTFLKQMQQAVRSPFAVPFSRSDQEIAQSFNQVFNHASALEMSRIISSLQAAHTQIIDRWRSHTGATNWVNFNNIGSWGTNYLDRAAATEMWQWGNVRTTATYYNAFVGSDGLLLDCSTEPAYILRFPKGQVPEAKRFWSLTAYLPDTVTLVPNLENKYAVASYTPGLVTEPNGSIRIYIQPTMPLNPLLRANWLPVPEGPLSLAIRVYGPTGNTAPGAGYEPPSVRATFLR